MYILKNSLVSIIRNKGRNILIGLIILTIACASTVTLAIRNTANRIVKNYEEAHDLIATISFDRNQLSKKSFDLGLLLANSFEALLAGTISLTLYIFLFIPKANYNLMIEGILIHPENFYYYSEQPNNPYYDNITSPMRLITFEPLFFIIILFILTYLSINIYATKSSKNQKV